RTWQTSDAHRQRPPWRAGPHPANRRFSISISPSLGSLLLRRLFRRLAAIGIGGVAEVLPRVLIRSRLVIHEKVRVRPGEDLRILPGESHLQLLACREQLVVLDQLGARGPRAAAWEQKVAAIIEADGLDDERLALPMADRVAIRRRIEHVHVRMTATIYIDVPRGRLHLGDDGDLAR